MNRLLKLRKVFSRTDLYVVWRDSNMVSHAYFFNLLAIAVSVLMIPGDHLFLEHTLAYSEIRAVGILILIANLAFAKLTEAMGNQTYNPAVQVLRSASLTLPVYLFTAQYLVFCFVMKAENFPVYFTALLFVISYSTFLLYRFDREEMIYHISVYLSGIALLNFGDPGQTQSVYVLMIINTASWAMGVFFLRDFALNLEVRHTMVSAFIPKIVARHIVTTNDFSTMNKIFKPRYRYTVCLCCDWRGYQQMIQVHPPDLISSLTEDFYNRVFASLDRVDVTGQYFANWTADELFIIFFDQNDSIHDVNQRALRFAFELSNNIFLDIRYDFDIDLRYDIGLACGSGYLGLQGPAKLKKTTITGRSAGLAKRLETEAKVIRQRDNENPNPILLLDQALFEEVQIMPELKSLGLKQIEAETKDISGELFYKYQGDYIDVRGFSRKTG